MKQYVEFNIAKKSNSTIEYILKMEQMEQNEEEAVENVEDTQVE